MAITPYSVCISLCKLNSFYPSVILCTSLYREFYANTVHYITTSLTVYHDILYVDMCQHLTTHGDGVKDVAFNVEDLDGIMRVRPLFFLSHMFLKF